MTKPPAKRHRKGMLASMVKYPKSPQHKKDRSLLRKIGFWAGATVLGAGLLAMATALLMTAFNPKIGQREGEADFTVESVEENPPGYPPEDKVVATAVVVIEKTVARVPLTAETRAGVEKGSVLQVRYEYVPRMSIVRILEWRLVPGASGKGSSGTDAPSRP
jgi:hypothetical protein